MVDQVGRFRAAEPHARAPSDNVMLGLSRYMRGARTVQHEFSRITADSTGVFLLPFPGGSPSEHAFRLTELEDGRAIFEAPEHDFPKRVIYRRNADGSNTARIHGGEGSEQAQEWRMQSVAFPGAGTRQLPLLGHREVEAPEDARNRVSP